MMQISKHLLTANAGVRRRIKPDVNEWVTRNLRFDTTGDALSSYVHGKSPYNKVIFEWWANPTIEEIFMLYPTQAGKTTAMNACVAYSIRNDPGPIIFVQSTEETTKAFLEKRMKRMLVRTFPDLFPVEWTDERGAQIGNADLYPAWSTSEDRCRSFARRYVFGDETSIWRCSRQLVWERTKKFKRNRKGLWGTTPTIENEQSWIAATEVFQLHRWQVPCPHCGAFQALEFLNLRFDQCKREDGTWDLEAVERDAFYECAHCKSPILQAQRQSMLQLGQAVCLYPERSSKRVSLRITALDVPDTTWGETARKFLESQADPEDLRVFINGWLVEPWRPRQEGLDAERIKKRSMALQAEAVPPNTECILAAVDVQRGHVWVTVRAFMEDGRSVLIHCQRVEGRRPDGEATTTYALDRCWDLILSRQWRVGESESRMGVMSTIVDSGDGTTAAEVYGWADRHRGRVVLGKGSGTQATPWRMSSVDRMPDGRAIATGLRLYTVRTEYYREIVIGAYTSSPEDHGAWLVSAGTPREYVEHLTSWQVEQARRQRDNRLVRQWKQIRRDDHYLDCECYCAALHEILRFVPKQPRRRVAGIVGKAWA